MPMENSTRRIWVSVATKAGPVQTCPARKDARDAPHYSHFGDPEREAERVLGSSEALEPRRRLDGGEQQESTKCSAGCSAGVSQ